MATKKRLRILCVEDSSSDFDLLQDYFEDPEGVEDLELTRVGRLQGAREKLEEQPESFDLILLDLFLPDSQGQATFHKVHQLVPRCPIVVLTANEQPNMGRTLVQEGAEDFLPKDAVDRELLLRTLRHAIERKRNQVELHRVNTELRRLNTELQETRLQLIQAEKLDSLERLASGLAHEVKNPLATLQMGVDYFERKRETSPEDEKILGSMQSSIERANEIISDMVEFSRSKDLDFGLENLNLVARRAVNLVEPDAHGSKIEVELSLAEDLPALRLDPQKMEQVVVNLVANAIEASPIGGRIRISTGMAKRGEIAGAADEESDPNEEICFVEVRDWGSGIEETHLPKIFDPFFSAKSNGKFTGLGLSVSRTIVSLHEGILTVDNADPEGVAARVILPVS